jgi:hypothetical protein
MKPDLAGSAPFAPEWVSQWVLESVLEWALAQQWDGRHEW